MQVGKVRASKKAMVFIMIILFGGSFFSFHLFNKSMKEYKASKSWPSVSGTITRSEIETRAEWDSKKKKTIKTYIPHVNYTFQVKDRTFTGTRVSFGDYRSNSRMAVRALIRDYPINKTVKVYYNPQDPSMCVLERKLGLGSYVALIVAIMFGLTGLLIVFVFFRRIITGV